MTTEAKWSDFASKDGAKTIAAANGLLPQWVSALLVVIIAWQLAKIIWMLVPGASAGDPVTAPANTPVTMGQSSTSADAQAIVTAHIFGEADPDMEPATPVLEEIDNLQDTRLTNLSLKGTIAATPTEMAIAIIADGRDEEKVYSIGELVTSGANLHAVYADRVVLNENGVLTNLKLPKDFPEGSAPVNRRNTTTTSRATTSTQSIRLLSHRMSRGSPMSFGRRPISSMGNNKDTECIRDVTVRNLRHWDCDPVISSRT